MNTLEMIEEWENNKAADYCNSYAVELLDRIKAHHQRKLLNAYRVKLISGPECFSNHIELLARIEIALNGMLDMSDVLKLCKEYEQ